MISEKKTSVDSEKYPKSFFKRNEDKDLASLHYYKQYTKFVQMVSHNLDNPEKWPQPPVLSITVIVQVIVQREVSIHVDSRVFFLFINTHLTPIMADKHLAVFPLEDCK